MGNEISCQLTQLNQPCYSSISTINMTLNDLYLNNYILNHENSKFINDNIYKFTCINDFKSYNGTLICNNKNINSTISCGNVTKTFQHKKNCLFGFQFKNNETLIFQSNNLNTPLISFPLPAHQLIVSTKEYKGKSIEKWVLRKSHINNLNDVKNNSSINIINDNKNINKLNNKITLKSKNLLILDTINKNLNISDQIDMTNNTGIYNIEMNNNTLNNNINNTNNNNNNTIIEKNPENNTYIIPINMEDIRKGASLSFNLPTNILKENNITLNVLNNNNKIINKLEFTKCCGKLKDIKNDKFDKFIYPSDFFDSDLINLTLSWSPSMIILYSSKNLLPLSILTIVPEDIPYKVELISNNKKISTNWDYKSLIEEIDPNKCTLTSNNKRCKSSKVEIFPSIKSNIEYLRFGFMYPNSLLLPITLNIYRDSTFIGKLIISKKLIQIYVGNNEKKIELKEELKVGEWFSGDIFIVTSELHDIIESSKQITCKDYTDKCLNSQKNLSWMSLNSDDSTIRYAYLMDKVIIEDIKNSYNISNSNSTLTNSKSNKYKKYLYISFDNCIILRAGIEETTFNVLKLINSQNLVNLSYWKINSGISPSINIPSTELSNIKETIKREINSGSNNKIQKNDQNKN